MNGQASKGEQVAFMQRRNESKAVPGPRCMYVGNESIPCTAEGQSYPCATCPNHQ